MASYFNLTLDTVGPASPSINLGGTYTSNQLITSTLGTSDSDTTGYQVLLWGDIDPVWARSVGILPAGSDTSVTTGNAQWISFATSQQIKLSAGDALKTINMKIRDKVYNESSQVSATITLSASLPTVTIVNGQADVTEVGLNPAKNTANFSFNSSQAFSQYKVCVVSIGSATQDQGTAIGTSNGSTGTSGNAGNYLANTNYNAVLKTADIKAVSSADGQKIIKVFVQNMAGVWSVA